MGTEMKDKISIIIPVYNAETTIERCVRSLCGGSYNNIEILLIDDDSKDRSLNICYMLQQKYSNVRVFHQETNQGVSQARNRGLREMTGEYLMFVDSDDWVEPEFVEQFVSAYKQSSADMIICGYINHDEVQNGATDYFGWRDFEKIKTCPLRESLPALLSGRLLQQIWNKFFKVSIIREHGITFDPTIKMGEDYRFLLHYLACIRGDKLVLINKPLYHYIRCSGASAMSNFGTESIDEPLKNCRLFYQLIGKDCEEIEVCLKRDKDELMHSYAYLIMHNMGMKMREKKKRILALSKNDGKSLYKKNKQLYFKERMWIWLKKWGVKR